MVSLLEALKSFFFFELCVQNGGELCILVDFFAFFKYVLIEFGDEFDVVVDLIWDFLVFLGQHISSPVILIEFILVNVSQDAFHSFKMNKLIFSQNEKQFIVLWVFYTYFRVVKRGNNLLDHKIKKKGNVSFEPEVLTVFQNGIPFFLFIFKCVNDFLALFVVFLVKVLIWDFALGIFNCLIRFNHLWITLLLKLPRLLDRLRGYLLLLNFGFHVAQH